MSELFRKLDGWPTDRGFYWVCLDGGKDPEPCLIGVQGYIFLIAAAEPRQRDEFFTYQFWTMPGPPNA